MLLDLCAHVAGYQAVLKQWESNDISIAREDNISVVNFPSQELTEYAAAAFGRLKSGAGPIAGLDLRDGTTAEAFLAVPQRKL